MLAFDTSFLLDYLDGEDATAEFLAAHEDKPFHAPTLALFEVYRGAARVGEPEQMERAVSALSWVDPLPLTDATAREAAAIESELRNDGMPINLGDVLIAGVCRHNGARVVTRDDDFDHVDGLNVVRY